MRVIPYAPAIVCALWALFTSQVGDLIDALWMVALGVSLVLMVWALRRRYRRDGLL